MACLRLLGAAGQVICSTTDPDINPNTMCGGPTVSPNPASIRDCCLGDGFFFRLIGDEFCFECVGEWNPDCCVSNPW